MNPDPTLTADDLRERLVPVALGGEILSLSLIHI